MGQKYLKPLPYPEYEKVLREMCRPIAEDEFRKPWLKELVRNMFRCMHQNNGAGLSAPQVGYSIRLFVMNCDPLKVSKYEQVFINPQLVAARDWYLAKEEGCLSFKGQYFDKIRPKTVECKAYNLRGELFERKLRGVEAQCFMHENEHLDGILIPDAQDPKIHELYAADKILAEQALEKAKAEVKKNLTEMRPEKVPTNVQKIVEPGYRAD